MTKKLTRADVTTDLVSAAKLLTKLKANYRPDSEERRLLLLVKDASFFAYLNEQAFVDFVKRMEKGLTDEQLEKLEIMGIKSEG